MHPNAFLSHWRRKEKKNERKVWEWGFALQMPYTKITYCKAFSFTHLELVKRWGCSMEHLKWFISIFTVAGIFVSKGNANTYKQFKESFKYLTIETLVQVNEILSQISIKNRIFSLSPPVKMSGDVWNDIYDFAILQWKIPNCRISSVLAHSPMLMSAGCLVLLLGFHLHTS